jgi:hypothetical protein
MSWKRTTTLHAQHPTPQPAQVCTSDAGNQPTLLFAAASNDGANSSRSFPAKYPGGSCRRGSCSPVDDPDHKSNFFFRFLLYFLFSRISFYISSPFLPVTTAATTEHGYVLARAHLQHLSEHHPRQVISSRIISQPSPEGTLKQQPTYKKQFFLSIVPIRTTWHRNYSSCILPIHYQHRTRTTTTTMAYYWDLTRVTSLPEACSFRAFNPVRHMVLSTTIPRYILAMHEKVGSTSHDACTPQRNQKTRSCCNRSSRTREAQSSIDQLEQCPQFRHPFPRHTEMKTKTNTKTIWSTPLLPAVLRTATG